MILPSAKSDAINPCESTRVLIGGTGSAHRGVVAEKAVDRDHIDCDEVLCQCNARDAVRPSADNLVQLESECVTKVALANEILTCQTPV